MVLFTETNQDEVEVHQPSYSPLGNPKETKRHPHYVRSDPTTTAETNLKLKFHAPYYVRSTCHNSTNSSYQLLKFFKGALPWVSYFPFLNHVSYCTYQSTACRRDAVPSFFGEPR